MSRSVLFAVIAWCAATVAGADAPASITMADAIPFEADVAGEVGLLSTPGGTADNIQQRCDLPQIFSQSIAAELRKKGIEVAVAAQPDAAGGAVLHVTIEGVLGFSGPWKGPKTLVLRGELRDGDTLVGSFVVRESNGMGALFKNTCEEFATLGNKAAADIAKWAKAPKVHARLGSA